MHKLCPVKENSKQDSSGALGKGIHMLNTAHDMKRENRDSERTKYKLWGSGDLKGKITETSSSTTERQRNVYP